MYNTTRELHNLKGTTIYYPKSDYLAHDQGKVTGPLEHTTITGLRPLTSPLGEHAVNDRGKPLDFTIRVTSELESSCTCRDFEENESRRPVIYRALCATTTESTV